MTAWPNPLQSLLIYKMTLSLRTFAFFILFLFIIKVCCSHNSEDDSGSESSSSASSNGSSTSSSSYVEDFGINGCSDPEHFTVVYDSFRHYDTIVESNPRASFLIGLDEISCNLDIIAKIRASNHQINLIYYVDFEKLVELSDIQSASALEAAVEEISRNFAEITGWKLYHVMLPYGAHERIVNAFTRLRITVVSVARKYQKVSKAVVIDFIGVVLIKTKSLDTFKRDFVGLKDKLERNLMNPVSLFECIPPGSVIDDTETETENETENEPVPITSCRTQGIFTLLFKGGLAHYDNLLLHDQKSAIVITTDDLNNRKQIIRKAIRNQRNLVVSLTERDLSSVERANACLRLIVETIRFKYLMISERVPRQIRQIFTLHPGIKVIKPQNQFTVAEEFNSNSIFAFRNFVLVDLEGTASPSKLLQTLESKMESQDCSPVSIYHCLDTVNHGAVRSEEFKRNQLYNDLNYLDRFRNNSSTKHLYVNRETIFEDSFDQIQPPHGDVMRSWQIRVDFTGEDGIDIGGIANEWFSLLVKQIFNPNYALFTSSETDQILFHPNPDSSINPNHLNYFKFVGRFIGKAVFDRKPIECNFSRAFYKMILGRRVTLYDLKEVDGTLYSSLLSIANNSVEGSLDDQNFTIGTNQFGVMSEIELKSDGSNIYLTDANKFEYISLMIQYKLYESCREQIDSFLEGFYEIIPKEMIIFFGVKELERLISGVSEIDVDDWEANTVYSGGYDVRDDVIRWFWRAVRSMTNEERRKLLHFVTGSPSVPLEGFSFLRSDGSICQFRITSNFGNHLSLPEGHTCFNRLDLPRYRSYETLRERILLAINEGTGAFHLD